ncbi:hypothetical protein BH24BAC1_BH24BAC1_15790 [soil metagenome]
MFRTEINIPSSPSPLGLASKVVTAGSCFSDVVGKKLQHYKVDALVNPFGNIFNPVSLCHLLEMACSQNYDLEEHLVQHNDIWYHYAFHSSFSSPDQQALLEKMKEALARTQDFLRSAQLLVLTFGTAVAYELKDEGTVVANCHKLPDQNFERRLLTYYEMVDAFGAMCAQLKMLNPSLKILLTVSPVRHLKETIILNSVSKANLRIACHHFTENFPDVSYFPAYELMLDDLRDYRFYQDDMIHPSSLAENYIWQKFTKSYFGEDFHAFLPEWDQIQKSLSHTPFHPESRGHQHFLRNLLGSLHRLAQKVNVRQEIEKVRQQLGPEPEPERRGPERRLPPAPPEKPRQEEQEEETAPVGNTEEPPVVAETLPENAPVPPKDKIQPRPDKSRKNKKVRGKKVVLEPVGRKKAPEPEPTPATGAPTPAPAPLPVANEKRAERPIKIFKQKARPEPVSAAPPAEAPAPPPVALSPAPVEQPQPPQQPPHPQPEEQPQPVEQPAVPEAAADLPAPPASPGPAQPKKRPPRKKPVPKQGPASELPPAELPSSAPAPAPAPDPVHPAPEASAAPKPPRKPRKAPVSRKGVKAGPAPSPNPGAEE